jgi:hypothetical protein
MSRHQAWAPKVQTAQQTGRSIGRPANNRQSKLSLAMPNLGTHASFSATDLTSAFSSSFRSHATTLQLYFLAILIQPANRFGGSLVRLGLHIASRSAVTPKLRPIFRSKPVESKHQAENLIIWLNAV